MLDRIPVVRHNNSFLLLSKTAIAGNVTMRVEAVLFDLFNTLVLLDGDDAFYMPSLKRLHNFLVQNEIDVSFEDFVRVYFQVRDRVYEETNESLEDPHFNIRVSRTLQKFGYTLEVSHPTIVGATEAFCEEFMKYARPDDDALYVLKMLNKKHKLQSSPTCPFLNVPQNFLRSLISAGSLKLLSSQARSTGGSPALKSIRRR
jgi:hypothetical protein